MNDCVFCKIVRGEEAAKIIYEDDESICFLPKTIEVFGHTLVVPKQHFQDLYDIPEELLCKLIKVVQFLTKEYKTRIGATGMNVLHASGKDGQQSVFHFHFHLLPRFRNDGLDTWPKLPKKDFDVNEIYLKLKING